MRRGSSWSRCPSRAGVEGATGSDQGAHSHSRPGADTRAARHVAGRRVHVAVAIRRAYRVSGKWQATVWSGAADAIAINGGSVVAQISWAFQQRVRKRQPEGGLIGEGTSPVSRIRSRAAASLRVGSGIGTAESSALVYGCSGAP